MAWMGTPCPRPPGIIKPIMEQVANISRIAVMRRAISAGAAMVAMFTGLRGGVWCVVICAKQSPPRKRAMHWPVRGAVGSYIVVDLLPGTPSPVTSTIATKAMAANFTLGNIDMCVVVVVVAWCCSCRWWSGFALSRSWSGLSPCLRVSGRACRGCLSRGGGRGLLIVAVEGLAL